MTPAEIRRLMEAATPGPWTKMWEGVGGEVICTADALVMVTPEDRALIVALVNAAPLLLAAAELAEACVEYHDSGKKVDRRAECLAAVRSAPVRS